MLSLGKPTIVRLFAEDRFLFWAALVLSALVLLPLTQTDVLPLVDLGTHLGLIAQISRILSGDPMAVKHYMLQPHPSPYVVVYAMLWASTRLFGLYLGAKLVVAFAVLLTPLGVMRLAHALGRSPRMALWAYALCWDFNQSMGFLAFTTTTGLAFFFLGRAAEALGGTERQPLRWWVTTAALGLILAMSHAHVAGTASALVGAMALTELPNTRRFWRGFWISTVPTFALLPWLVWSRLDNAGREVDIVAPTLGLWPNAGARVGQLFQSTFGIVTPTLGRCIEGLTFLCLLVMPLVYAAMRPGLDQSRRYVLGMYVASWFFFLVMPHELYAPFYQYFINDRHVIYILLIGLLLPAPLFNSRRGLRMLAPGIVLAALMACTITWQFNQFHHHIAPFWRIADRIPPGSRYTVIFYEHKTPESGLRSITQLPAYVVAEKGGFMPFLFHTPNLPVLYVAKEMLSVPPWYDGLDFDMLRDTEGYDYLIVQGEPEESFYKIARDRGLPAPPRFPKEVLLRTRQYTVEHRLTSGEWRLYEIVKTPPRAG